MFVDERVCVSCITRYYLSLNEGIADSFTQVIGQRRFRKWIQRDLMPFQGKASFYMINCDFLFVQGMHLFYTLLDVILFF